MSAGSTEKNSVRWPWVMSVMSEHGPKKPNTRFVLLALAQMMKSDGSDCYPSFRRLSEMTGMSKNTVNKYILLAEAEGWIKISVSDGSGKGWKRNVYHPILPKGVPRFGTPVIHNVSQIDADFLSFWDPTYPQGVPN